MTLENTLLPNSDRNRIMLEEGRTKFRVVMLTDDVIIDRRILLQASTLQTRGAEVILLAQGGKDITNHEIVEGIKVARYYAPEVISDWPQRIMSLQQRLVNHLNRRSLQLQTKFTNQQSAINGRISNLIASRRFFRTFFVEFRRKLQVLTFKLASQYTVRAPAILSLKVAQVSTRIFLKFVKPPSLSEHLAELASAHRPDIIHAHDLPQLEAAIIVKERLGIPAIYDAHELYPEIGTLTEAQKRAASKKEKQFIGKADGVTTVNPFIAEEMSTRYSVKKPRILLNATRFPVGFDPLRPTNLIKETLGLPKTTKVVLFQGWYHRSRGLEDLVKSMCYTSNDIHLVFLGYGEEDVVLALRKELEIENRVHILPKVPWDELINWTSSADCGIIPYQKTDLNNYLCSPNKLFEFIMAGLPILCNDFPFLDQVVKGEGFGITGPLTDEHEFAALINNLFEDDGSKCDQFRRSMYEKYDKFDWASQEPVLLEVFEKALNISLEKSIA